MDPQSLLFLPTHEWVFIQSGVATVGISQFAVEQLTDLLLVELPRVGDPVVTGKSFGEIESVKAVSDLYSPVDGEVIEVNSAVATDVQVLARDPYGEGWLIKVRLGDPHATIPGLMDYPSYRRQVAETPH
jgi:glycine cleavage system H protein